MITEDQLESILEWLLAALRDDVVALPIEAGQLTVDDWASVLEAMPSDDRQRLWDMLAAPEKGAILAAMRDDARNQLLSHIEQPEIVSIARNSTPEQVVEILDAVPEGVAQRIIRRLSPEDQSSVASALAYDEEQLGRYLVREAYVVNGAATVSNLLVELKTQELPPYTDSFLVIDDAGRYLGQVDLNMLLGSPRSAALRDIADSLDIVLTTEMPLLEASNRVKNSGRSMLPVLGDEGQLLGRFSLRDAVDVFQEHFEAQIMHLGQVADEDLFAPIAVSAGRRAIWLGINLLTAFLASAVIGLFDDVVAQVVALAVLMPIVASMGGITGSQTLTLTIRGLATGRLASSNLGALGSKELSVALLNGLLWGVVVAICAGLWFGNPQLSYIIAGSLLVNMLVAAAAGIAIPVLLERNGIDPALAGSVILTTVTDVVGFLVFLGSAALLLV